MKIASDAISNSLKFSVSLFVFVKIKVCLLIILILFGCRNAQDDILYATADEVLLPEHKGWLRLHEAVYKNANFQITGEVIFKEQAKDNIPFKNKSNIYFGKRDVNNNLIANKLIVCYFDILIYEHVNIGDNIIVQGYFKGINKNDSIIFEKCRIVKPAFSSDILLEPY